MYNLLLGVVDKEYIASRLTLTFSDYIIYRYVKLIFQCEAHEPAYIARQGR